MEKVQKLVGYQYQHKDGYKLLLCYGRTVDGNGRMGGDYQNQRWLIISSHSPIPVRNATWFQGFDFGTMNKYLSDAGFVLVAKTNFSSGFITVFRGNESVADVNEPYRQPLSFGKPCFERVVRELVEDGHDTTARFIWLYAHGGTLTQARAAVKALVDKGN